VTLWVRVVIVVITLFGAAFSVSAETAKRIVALSPHAVELLFAIGAGDNIVGTVEYADFPVEAQRIPRIGSYHGIQVERLISLNPDLIVAWKSGNKMADLNKLHSLGYRIFYTHPQNIAQISKDLVALGEITGNVSQAETQSSQLAEWHQSIKAKYGNRRPVKVFYQLWHDPLRTVGEGRWLNSLISDCRGENIFAGSGSDYPQVSMESVIKINPEVIIVPHHSGHVGAKTALWNGWEEVDAVRLKRVFTLNGDLLHRFSPRALDGLELLCELIDQGR